MNFVYEISEPIVEPVMLEEAKNHLRLSRDFTDDDELIKTLITMARMDAEAKTGGRVFPMREWEWIPADILSAGGVYEVPVSPALNIKAYNREDGTEIPLKDYRFIKSSLAPHGAPLFAKIIPLVDLENVRFVIEAGWPNKNEERDVVYSTPPKFLPENTVYTENSFTLQFDRAVSGEVDSRSFTVIVDGDYVDVYDVDTDAGKVTVHINSSFTEGSEVEISYTSGFLKDKDDNYVMPILKEVLPVVAFGKDAPAIPATEKETISISTTPAIVKSWILVRVSTLYQQRSEIAIQAGKTSNAFFPRPFINGMLDAYTIERA